MYSFPSTFIFSNSCVHFTDMNHVVLLMLGINPVRTINSCTSTLHMTR